MKKILLLILVVLSITTSTQAQEYETGSYASTNFPANDIDTTDYTEIPVVKEIEDCFGDYYVYYFTVGKTRFRAVHIFVDTFPQIITIQKLAKGKWYNRLAFQHLNHYGCVEFKDVNNDGYLDLVLGARFDSEVYFYNPAIHNFIDSLCCRINEDVHLIDAKHHIYCDYQSLKSMCGQLTSTLYTIKNFKKQVLFHLELVNCNEKREEIDIKELILSKCINGDEDNLREIKTIHLKKPLIDSDEPFFNNKAFWLKRYKKLLGYK